MRRSSEIPRSVPINPEVASVLPESEGMSDNRPPLGERLKGHVRAVIDIGRRAVDSVMAPAKDIFRRGMQAAGSSLLEQIGVGHDKETGFKLQNPEILGNLALSLITGSTADKTKARQNLKPTAGNMLATAAKAGVRTVLEHKK